MCVALRWFLWCSRFEIYLIIFSHVFSFEKLKINRFLTPKSFLSLFFLCVILIVSTIVCWMSSIYIRKMFCFNSNHFSLPIEVKSRFSYRWIGTTGKILFKRFETKGKILIPSIDTTGRIRLRQILGDGEDPLTKLARRAKFFMKNSHDGQDFYDILPNLPWAFFEYEHILRKDQTRRDQTRSDETRPDQML